MLLTGLLMTVACSPSQEIKVSAAGPSATSSAEPPVATLAPATTEPAGDEPTVPVEGCDRKTIGEDFGPIAVAYAVQDGRLAPAPCFGEASDVVEQAWNDLAVVTPPQLIDGVTILAGFDDAASDTLAFAGPVSNDSDEHLIAVGITAAVDDPQELRLTMAHELAHVFTQTTDQIDVALFARECDTFYNGFGCFQQDAYVTAWVDQFWDPRDIAELPRDYSVDIDGGEDRCVIDPGFPGSYAASHPEEDFAESFSAYVFDVDMPDGFLERAEFFDSYPEFIAMRQAIRRADVPVPPGNFDLCG